MRLLKKPLDWALAAIALLSVAVVFLGHEDPFVREGLCSRFPCPTWPHSHAWEKIAYDLGIGSLVSLLFYALVVRLPEHQKRKRIKRSFRKQYHFFKEDSISTMLMVADGTYSVDLPERLVDQNTFRDYFKMKVSPSQDRWDALHNRMDQYHLNQLLTSLEILRNEIAFVLTQIDIEDDEPFEFLKRVSGIIFTMRNTTLDYGSMKTFGNFMWDVFAGFSVVTGYRNYDIMERMINAM